MLCELPLLMSQLYKEQHNEKSLRNMFYRLLYKIILLSKLHIITMANMSLICWPYGDILARISSLFI